MKRLSLLFVMLCWLMAKHAAAQDITLTTDVSSVAVGQSYLLTLRANGDTVHNVYVDGVYWGTFLAPGECFGSAPIICTHTWTKTPTQAGTVTHTATSLFSDGSARPPVTASVTVTSSVPSAWDATTALTTSSPIYTSHAADGTTVLACLGDGTLYCRFSFDQGASWGPWQNLGSGTLYLERPVAFRAGVGLVATVDVSRTITDFWGQRPVGDLSIRRYSNGAFTAKQPLTSGAAAFRVSTVIDGPRWCVAWMDYRRGQWDIYVRCSQDSGGTWAPEQIVGVGTNAVGAGRPAITMQDGIGVLAWMDARDTHPACQLEGGATIPVCTEIYTSRTTDGGQTWSAPQRRTVSGNGYAGRPDLAMRGSTVVLVYDTRAVGALNDIAAMRSTDGGATWEAPSVWAVPGEQTHGVVAAGPGGFSFASMDARTGTYQIWFRSSGDGSAWSADEQVSSGSAAGAPAISQSDGWHHVTWAAGPMQYRRRVLTPVAPPPPPPVDPCVSDPLVVTASITATGHTLSWLPFLVTDERGCTALVP